MGVAGTPCFGKKNIPGTCHLVQLVVCILKESLLSFVPQNVCISGLVCLGLAYDIPFRSVSFITKLIYDIPLCARALRSFVRFDI